MKWEKKHIIDFGKVVTGKTPPTSERKYFDGPYMFVTPTDLNFNHYRIYVTKTTITEEGRKKHRNQFLPPNSVLYTCIGNTIGKIAINPMWCLTNQQINSIIPSEDSDYRFIYYYLLHITSQIRAMSGGVATPIVNKTTFEGVVIIKPPLPIQRRIADILSAYDDLIENNLRRIKLLEDAARCEYRVLMEGSKRGSTMDEICTISGGGTPSTKDISYWEGGEVPWFTPTDLTRKNSFVQIDSGKKITEKGLRGSSAKLLPPYTIMMTSRATIGYLSLSSKAACTNQGFINIIPRNEVMRYLLMLNLLSRKDELISNANGSTFLEVPKSNFKRMLINVPTDINALASFHSSVHTKCLLIESLALQNDQLRQARDILLPKLMSGEIEVDEDAATSTVIDMTMNQTMAAEDGVPYRTNKPVNQL